MVTTRALLGLLLIISLAVFVGLPVGPARATTTFLVNTTADTADINLADAICDGSASAGVQCTLRAAIQESNDTAGVDTINFAIGMGQQTIDVNATGQGGLPAITDGVVIDGTSQPGYNAATPTPMIELKNTLVVSSQEVLSVFSTTPSTIKGLALTDAGGSGIALLNDGHVIQGNYIGLRLDGTTVLGNNSDGIFANAGTDNVTIGGATAVERNVISGNDRNGVELNGTSSTDSIIGNFIGTDATGTLDRGNGGDGVILGLTGSGNVVNSNFISGNAGAGVRVSGTSNSVSSSVIGAAFGGAALPNGGGGLRVLAPASSNVIGPGNIFSGNTGNGISIEGGDGTTVKGNQVGTWSGNTALPNGVGIFISGSPTNTTIGGSTVADRNTISGNTADGISITGGTGTVIKGNYIGLGFNGTTTIGNGDDGIGEGGTTGVTIGGAAAGEGNVISANIANGIQMTGDSHVVKGNYIGLSATGTLDRGNHGDGVRVVLSEGATIGGVGAGDRNVIAGNDSDGIEIASGVDNSVLGNYIGLAVDGSTDVGNTLDGIRISDSGLSGGNVVGGIAAGARNVISGNNLHGVEITGSGSVGTTVQSNYIGTDLTGTLDRGNSSDGVRIDASSGNIIGEGTGGNTLSGNNSDGIELINNSDTNSIQQNHIGTNALATAALGNTTNGIRLDGSTNTIRANIIGGNLTGDGIDVQAGSAGNTIVSNFIGVALNGTTAIGNAINGIQIQGASNNNLIGSSSTVDRNRLANNTSGDGVAITSTNTGNLIGINEIHDNGGLGIDLNDNGAVNANDANDVDTGANNLQNFPVLTAVTRTGVNIGVSYTLNTTASTTVTTRFFYSTACDASGNGEGATYIGALSQVTNVAGNAAGSPQFAVYVPAGAAVTATTTATGNNTSEFSNCVTAPPFVVNSNADPGDGTCDATCTLRDAITNANSVAGQSTIHFAIGTGTQTITPATPLPTITSPVIIDGTSQPGFAGTPIIQLNGASAGADTDGLVITAGSSTIRGLVINRFGSGAGIGDGIVLQSKGFNVIVGNYIGTNVAGTAQLSNTGNGVSIASPSNTIGGVSIADRNVISGNNSPFDNGGIEIVGASARENVVQGNYIGTNAAGTAAVANGLHGILIDSASDNTIGGPLMGAENVIAGNFRPGIIMHAANTNLIQRNFIGTNSTGTVNLGNNENGVVVDTGSSNNTFLANTIAFNPGDGIQIADGTGNKISQNSMYSQSSLGIDLNADHAIAHNDSHDVDTGPNNLQNFPNIILATDGVGQAVVNGALNSTSNATFSVEYFYNTACDALGNGEGREYLAAQEVTTDANGNVAFSDTISRVGGFAGSFLTVTATDAAGNTSEFSPCVPVTTDADADGFANGSDNCPKWANAPPALPNWSVPIGDYDCDGFPDFVPQTLLAPEDVLGTDPDRHCALTSVRNDEPGVDAWPMDFDDSQRVNGQDFLAYNFAFGLSTNGPPVVVPGIGTIERRRFDLSGNGLINGQDFLRFNVFFGKVCS